VSSTHIAAPAPATEAFTFAQAARSPQRLFLWAGIAVVFGVYRNPHWGSFNFEGLLLILLAATLAAQAIEHSSRALPDRSCRNRRPLWLLFLVLAIVYLALALYCVRILPGGVIDVYVFQDDAMRALLRGINPYTITHANIYGPHTGWVDPKMIADGRVHIGFAYPPLTLYYVLPGYLVGDVRYSPMVAILLSVMIVFILRPHWQTLGIAVILLLDPLTYFVITQSWTEPLVLLTLCLVVYVAVRHPRWLPLALGLFFASKQYTVLALPLAAILVPEFRWRDYLRLMAQAIAVAAALTAPLALWNPQHFWADTVLSLLKLPFRRDALSFAVIKQVPMGGILVLVAVAILLSLVKSCRHPAMFAGCFGFTLLIFISVNKAAFANYYFLISCSFWLAAVTLPVPFGADKTVRRDVATVASS
jgi:hypothetical protein